MQDLWHKIDELIKALIATKYTNLVGHLPKLPEIKQIKPLAINKPTVKEAKLPGLAPDSKKNPKKIAEQIKNGSMSSKTEKLLTKSENITFNKVGQWFLE